MEAELRDKVAAVSAETSSGAGEGGDGSLAPIQEEEEEPGQAHDARLHASPHTPTEGTSEDGGGDSGGTSDGGSEDEEDDEVHVRRQVSGQPEHCPEDDDFLAAFDKMMTDSVMQRVQEGVNVPAPDISVPIGLRSKMGRPQASGADEEEPEEGDEEDTAGEGGSLVRLSLLTRGKGGKVMAHGLSVPMDSDFVQLWKAQEAAEAAEKERIKAATLSISRRMEEEEAEAEERAILGLSTLQPHGLRKAGDKKSKFVHPKGAPNTKDIFGENWK